MRRGWQWLSEDRGANVRLTSLAANCTTAEKGAFSGTVTLHAQGTDRSKVQEREEPVSQQTSTQSNELAAPSQRQRRSIEREHGGLGHHLSSCCPRVDSRQRVSGRSEHRASGLCTTPPR
jgi:hypothetical protein